MIRRRAFALLVAAACTFLGASSRADPAPAPPMLAKLWVTLPPPVEDYSITIFADGAIDIDQRVTTRHRHRSMDTVDLETSGMAKTERRRVAPATLLHLKALLAGAALAAVPDDLKGTTWDVGTYRVTFTGADHKPRTISCHGLSLNAVPPAFGDLIDEIRGRAKFSP